LTPRRYSPFAQRTTFNRWLIPVGLVVLALAIRLLALGQFLTPDEYLWADRSRNFLAGLLDPAYVCESPANHTGFAQAVGLACTLRTGHPGVTTMWTGSLGILLRYLAEGMPGSLFDYVIAVQTNPLDAGLIAPLRLPTAVLTSLWVALLYWLVWRLFGDWRVALAAGLLLALDPFHAALSRVIHHDALATTFMTLSLLTALIYWVRRASRLWLIGSGILAGLAFLSKSPALFLSPFIALIGLWSLASRRVRGEEVSWRDVAVTVGDGLLWFGCAAAIFVALWPAMWVIPLETLRTVFFVGSRYASGGHAKGNFLLGTVSQDPGPLFYPVTWLLRSSPLVWVGLLAVFIAFLAQTMRKSASQEPAQPAGGRFNFWRACQLGGSPVCALLLFAVLFVAFMTLGEKKQDRYILPIYPALSIVAAVGLVRLLDLKSPLFKRPALLLLIVLLVQGMLVATNYPYYFTYYNPLLGGTRGALRVMTIGWGEGLDLAAKYLNQKPDAERLRVSAWYQSTLAPFFKGEAISYSKEKGKAMAGDYVVFYVNQLQRRFPDDELFRYFEARFQPDKVISLKGVDYVVIYPGPRMQHYVEDRVDENRRYYQGIGALLGWDWPGAEDSSNPSVAGGEALPFRLYWEYLGKVPEEQFFFRLLGPDGRIWAEGSSRPVLVENGDPATWRTGQIITEQGKLPVPVGTPPGEYQVQIGFYTQAPAVTEGELVFDLPSEETGVTVTPSGQSADKVELPAARRQDSLLAELKLVGITFTPALKAGQKWAADLYWQAEKPPSQDYRARLSLVDRDGQTRWVWDPAPLVEFYPTSRWKAGQVVRSQVSLVPDRRTPGGQYDLVLTLLDNVSQPVGRTTLGAVGVEGRRRSFGAPPVDTPLGATLGDAIELVGFGYQPAPHPGLPGRAGEAAGPATSRLGPGEEVGVTLVWRALAPVNEDYTVTVQLLGPDGHVYGQHDAPPLDGAAPTSTWSPGEVLTDAHRFVVAGDAAPGEYRLVAGMYLAETGERLSARGSGEAITLANLDVAP